MSAKTKIVVVKAKELIYTALFVCLGIILILLLIFMFAPEEKVQKQVQVFTHPESILLPSHLVIIH